MYAGNMVETASSKEIFKECLHPYTKGLMSCIPKLAGGGLPRAYRDIYQTIWIRRRDADLLRAALMLRPDAMKTASDVRGSA